MSERRTFHFLNVVRFLSAAWVVIAHLAASPLNKSVFSPEFEWLRKGLIVAFSGVSAVMVFFVVSGFCIHYPYASGRPFRSMPFYVQRLTRIGLPLLVAAVLHHYAGTFLWLKNVLWAVYCEIIYYALYPLLRIMWQRAGAYQFLMGSLVVSWLFCLQPDSGYGHIMTYGDAWTWLVCLPVWLCGCVLANWLAGSMTVPALVSSMAKKIEDHLGLVRSGLWALSSVLLLLGIREILPFKYSLPVSGLLVPVWLLVELQRPNHESWLSRCGLAGYSIYLMHPLAELPQLLQFSGTNPVIYWALRLVLTMIVSAVFYFVVELPTHRLARRFGGARRGVSR